MTNDKATCGAISQDINHPQMVTPKQRALEMAKLHQGL